MLGNGSTWKLEFRPPSEIVTFTIGGQKIEVAALTLFAMDVVKGELLALGPDLDFIAYAQKVVSIIYKLTKLAHPEIQFEESDLVRACSIAEMRQLAVSMNELLGVSGFTGGPTEAEPTTQVAPLPGTGTSTELSPDLPPTESAPGISTE